MIAVAAVFAKPRNQHVRPVPTLLLYDFRGKLLSALALEPAREITRLTVDPNGNVWTLTSHADKRDPSTVPAIVEYSPGGTVARELLSRDTFPFHAKETKEDPSIGRPFMGFDGDIIWFWLPGSTELVTISATDGTSRILRTRVPERVGRNTIPLNITRKSSGDLASQVREVGDHGETEISTYAWSATTGLWSRVKPDACEGGMLIGINDKTLVSLQYKSDGADAAAICMSRTE
jgi:hypothetical protein